jgi:hypothetical protein
MREAVMVVNAAPLSAPVLGGIETSLPVEDDVPALTGVVRADVVPPGWTVICSACAIRLCVQ